jgi:hypothetical protein
MAAIFYYLVKCCGGLGIPLINSKGEWEAGEHGKFDNVTQGA